MNLLYTLTAYPPYIGGAQLHQHLLAQQLQGQHSVQVATFWNHNRTDWLLGTTLKAHRRPYNYEVDGIPVHRLGFGWGAKLRMAPWLPLYYPWMAMALPPIAEVIAASIEEFAPKSDLIHNVRIGREGLTYASWQVARRRGIPFVLTPVHHPRWVGWRYREFLKLYQQSDAIIALTQAEARILHGLGVSEHRLYVTGHGPILAKEYDAISFRKKYHIEGKCVLFLGQHYLYKGYRELLQSTSLIWKKFPETVFLFIGPQVKDSEQIFLEKKDPRILRLGTASLEEKTSALAACDLLCVPSTQESFGGVYTEAWMFKKPVIGCPIPAVSEVVSHGVDGLLVNQDPRSIADAIIQILQNSGFAASLGRSGHTKVVEKYNWEAIAEKTLSIYHQVLGND